MFRSINQDNLISPDTELTIAGGGTPSVTGPTLNLDNVISPLSLFLKNELTSDDLSVTYQVGFIDEADKVAQTITWVTPADGGAVADMTNKDCNGSQSHASISLACAKYYRFIVTNNAAAKTAKVSLYGTYQM